jgi:hypothetical protein
MINLFSFFKKPDLPTPPTPHIVNPELPAIGEVWQLKILADPWKDKGLTRIIDVKDGWVKYQIGWFDYRLQLDAFLRCYQPTK